LKTQYAARVPVEHWLLLNAAADLEPPLQTPLIARDLYALNESLPLPRAPIELGDVDEASVIGVAWVLAGSSLGNRAMLKDMQRARRDGETLPAQFLGDETMLSFWKRLRPRIEQPTTRDRLEAAASAATAIFDHFLSVAAPQPAAPAEPAFS
jgi:heme oxygenase